MSPKCSAQDSTFVSRWEKICGHFEDSIMNVDYTEQIGREEWSDMEVMRIWESLSRSRRRSRSL